MTVATLRRRRQQRRDARERARQDRRQQRRAVLPPADDLPLPDEATFLEEFCWWPDEATGKPVRGLSALQRDCIERSACFRLDGDGNRIGGSDCCRKPRKVRFTTLYLGRIFYALIKAWQRGEAWSATSAFEMEKPAKLRPILRRALFMLRRLPACWTKGLAVTGFTIGIKAGDDWVGWAWNLVSGGGVSTADSVGRGDTQHIVHLSEARKYRDYMATLLSLAGSMPSDGSGWLIDETTFALEKGHPSSQVYFDTREGKSRFTVALFWPWHADPSKRIRRGTPDYRRVMARDFPLSDDNRETEDRLGLDHEQRAYRRLNRCTGSTKDQREARAEYPESEEEVFRSSALLVYAEEALLALDAQVAGVSPIEVTAPITAGFVAAIYAMPRPDEVVVVGVDPAEFGRDKTAGDAGERRTRDQLAELHGNALDSEIADTIVWLAGRLGVATVARNAEGLLCIVRCDGRYWAVVERAKGLKLIKELQRRNVPLWCEPGTTRPGFTTSGHSRPRIFDAVREVVEGPDRDEDGNQRQKRPTAAIRSRFQAAQLGHIVWVDGRPDHEVGEHDDRVIALGIRVEASKSIPGPVAPLSDWAAAQTGRPTPPPESRYQPPV